MNSEITTPGGGAFGFKVKAQFPPANKLEALLKSRMPCPGAQATCTRPVGGGGNSNSQCEVVSTVRLVAGWPLRRKSLASTPATGSLKTISTETNSRTTALGAGKRDVIVGLLRSGV